MTGVWRIKFNMVKNLAGIDMFEHVLIVYIFNFPFPPIKPTDPGLKSLIPMRRL
jgi:hypothetical protein